MPGGKLSTTNIRPCNRQIVRGIAADRQRTIDRIAGKEDHSI